MHDEIKNVESSVIIKGDVRGNVQNIVGTESVASIHESDMLILADELRKLREAMQKKATDREQAIEVGNVAEAEQYAEEKNVPKVMEALKKVGSWTLGIAEEIGVKIAVECIKQAAGLG